MGKIKKSPSASKDEGQKKISNFFQKQSEKPAGKALFSEHGRTSKEKTVSKLKGDNPRPSSVAESKPSSVTCIPETQVLFTPPSVKSSSNTTPSNRDGSDCYDNNDFEVIPDTPKGKEEETVKAKRPLARSFLLSTTQMGSNPIQKAKENREAKLALKKKKACLAKQGLLSISVKFNDPSNVADKNNGNALLADNNNAVIDEVDNAAQMNDGKDILKPEGFTPTKIYSNGDSMKRMAKSGDSPTGKRTMSDSDSIKKQLNYFKGGNESTHSDKAGSDMTQLKPNDISPEFESDILAIKASEMKLKISRLKALEEERKQKEKEKLLERKRLEREENRRKSEKLMKYQVGGSTVAADKHRDLSLANDDALDDILQELSSPSVLKSTKTTNSSMLKLSKPANQILTKKLPPSFTKTKTLAKNNIVINSAIPNPSSVSRLGDKKLENSKSADNNISIDDWTDEDDEYLNKLDLDLNSNKSKMTKPTVIEADDIETFPTQGHHGEQRLRSQEMEIEEFATQQSKDSLINEMAGLSPFKQSKQSTLGQTEAPCTQYGRHVVTNIELSGDKHQMILSLLSQPGDITRTSILHDFWLDSHIEVGDTVHVLAEFIDNVCHITDKSGLLVINPDLLLSGTTVVSSVFCMRKSILKEKFKGCDSRNIQMLYGSIIHSVFQQMLKNKLHTADHITAAAKKIVYEPKNLLEMYANNVSEDKVMEEIKSYIPQMMSWVEKYTQFAATSFNKKLNDGDVQLTKVYDIEENIWSPRFGIKGKIDLTVEARTKQDRNTTLLPLELKTGKTSYSVEHKGQVTLYSMMCGDRRKDPGKGLLLYLKEPSMKIIPAEHLHQRGLIQLRNEMSYYISRQVQKSDSESQTYTLGRLPDPITNIRACQKCPQLVNCSIYQRQVEGRSPDSSGASGLVSETLGHLTTDHMTYFLKWCLMLDLETKLDQSKKTVADIWCKSSIQREEVGLCLGGMTLIPDSCEDLAEDSVILSFCRQKGHNKSTLLHHTGICKQDSVVISRESPAWVAVCTGFVHDISPTAIHILSERESVDRLLKMKDCSYRIDKCDNFSTAGIMYTNVSKLMTDDPHSLKLRRLIIDKVKPEFVNTLSKANIEKVKNIFKVLNKPQKSAILKVLMCKDYVLIRGYPGTGKTSTIVALVKVLHTLGQSVLLTSYTHSAVDNILLKLKKDGVNFLRLGRISKVHRDIQQYTWEKQTSSLSSVEDIEKFITKQQIVASSCLGMNHQVFTRRQFDVCIIDEASQVQQPACLGPVFLSTRFILVGDPKQLPPVVRSKEAKDLGMDESLFSHLDDLGATFDLNVQYRMNSAIMEISNNLVYNGCLKCGNDSVANRTLNIPRPDVTESVVINSRWMKDVYDSDLSKSVIMLDTQKLSANHKQVKTGGFTNETECQLVIKCVSHLCKAGITEDDIGVIAPYNSQVNLIRDRLSHGRSSSKVEVNTVDQYQGRDKNIIIISFVMSSDQNSTQVGELLRDIRRLNVAMTRAKMKLVLIGNVSFLRQYVYLKQVLDLVASDNINVLTEV